MDGNKGTIRKQVVQDQVNDSIEHWKEAVETCSLGSDQGQNRSCRYDRLPPSYYTQLFPVKAEKGTGKLSEKRFKWIEWRKKISFDTICATNCWMLANEATVSWKIDCCRRFFFSPLLSISLALQEYAVYLKAALRNLFRYRRVHRRASKRDKNGISRRLCVPDKMHERLSVELFLKNVNFWKFAKNVKLYTDSIHESHVLAELPGSESTVTTHQSGGFSPPWTVSNAHGWLIRK